MLGEIGTATCLSMDRETGINRVYKCHLEIEQLMLSAQSDLTPTLPPPDLLHVGDRGGYSVTTWTTP